MNRKKKSDCVCPVVAVQETAHGIYWLSFRAPAMAMAAEPGHFVFIKPEGEKAPLLRRAFSIASIEKDGNIAVCFDVKGPGTARLAQCGKGDMIRVLGPCGTPFPTQAFQAANVLIAGGMGIAPMLFLAQRLKRLKKKVFFYFGARSREQLVLLSAVKKVSDSCVLATEDGSAGKKGFVTLHVRDTKGAPVFACGPNPMLKAVSALFPDALVSLETRMACGLGVCMGCGVVMKDASIKRCCVNGPVFKGSEVQWD
ncbi:MAG: hypothetical protein A2268_15470 [Candidatus Raymondbacteria bacterium RifOxyA12_full_50_37]|uniref:FAD-binding FR-type domain-containing protein n=1 Tax=Candidatus Raymondbacteria bacterium RIFOXYD12_FULL_49_13 TaxID=1817890 RepID=A0A1F7F726_UNCRA|nr:MAG: hypothetical protein A2268_15470 [Candidatus Raymondbacteria bacterium RifOxyA12_full_50_37]OGJ87297.1 MAG: hypothetical protein A2350_04425 [Candidatus Raymondbacteria bacterium RifOxyB12_full_50_8]OGJ88447.1 MAG: hypothetical protein A2248_19795 [Candidatus Raymondbacteria bacterium RIFOXYA2_FULL_49_16]OGJ98907.1 MAG: hypothetical protein A2453_10510 [Candidatus Raymondbacteria bacterium RIFOXYC2_FULL_50_21]OGK02393.1 MAG: hypothetical protein A2519_16110 [Candidatus Raymondbacteria b